MESLLMKNRSTTLLLLVATALGVAACDLYTTRGTHTRQIQVLGDSGFDFSLDMLKGGRLIRALLKRRPARSPKWFDRSVSGDRVQDIVEQYRRALDHAKLHNYRIRTVMLTGGANDVAAACAVGEDRVREDGSVRYEELSEQWCDTCGAALERTAHQMAELLTEIQRDGRVDDVVLLSSPYHASRISTPETVDYTAHAARMICEGVPPVMNDGHEHCGFRRNWPLPITDVTNCTFVDGREAWPPNLNGGPTVPDSGEPAMIFDGAHYNVAGAERMAEVIWDAIDGANEQREKPIATTGDVWRP